MIRTPSSARRRRSRSATSRDVADAEPVDEGDAGLDLVDDPRRRPRSSSTTVPFSPIRIAVRGHAGLAREPRVRRQHPVLAVDRHHRASAGRATSSVRSSSEQAWPETWTGAISWCSTSAPGCASWLIESWTRSSFPGTGLRRDDHRVAALDRDRRVVAVGDPRQRRHRLALAAGAEDQLLVRAGARRARRGLTSTSLGHVDVAEVAGDVQVLPHRAADDRDLAADLDGDVDRLLHPVHVRRERDDEDRGPCGSGMIWRNASPTSRSEPRQARAARRSSSRRASGRRRGCRARRAGRRRSSARRPACGRASSRPCAATRPAAVSSTTATQSGIECAMRTNSSGTGRARSAAVSGSASRSSVDAQQAVLVELRLDEPERQPRRPAPRRTSHLAQQVRQRRRRGPRARA